MLSEKTSIIDTLCIELTNHCPLNCIHCSACASRSRTQYVDVDQLFGQIADLGRLKSIFLSGGEPFDHPQIFEAILRAKALADATIIYSSGTMLRGNEVAPFTVEFVSKIMATEPTRVDFSLYSCDARIHDAVTGVTGSFSATLETIRLIVKSGVKVGLHYVPVRYLPGQVKEIVRLAKDASVQSVHVLALVGQGRGSAIKGISEINSNGCFISELNGAIAESREIPIFVSSALQSEATNGSNKPPLRSSFIDSYGFIYKGEGFRTKEFRSGNSIFSGASLREALSEFHQCSFASI